MSELLLRNFLFGVIRGARLLPRWCVVIIGLSAGYLVAMVPTNDRRVCYLQLRRFLPESGSWFGVRQVYAHLGRIAAETLILPSLVLCNRYVTCHSWGVVREVFSRGKGAICLTAHTGNWDLMAAYFASRGLSTKIVARPPRMGAAHAVLSALRGEYGVRTLWRSTGRGSIREIMTTLDEGGLVAGLIDQDTTVGGRFVRFLGVETHTPTALMEIALARGVPVLLALNHRDETGQYVIHVEEIASLSADEELTIDGLLEQYAERLGQHVRTFPDQWVWVHKRWRTTRSEGRRSREKYFAWLLSESEQ